MALALCRTMMLMTALTAAGSAAVVSAVESLPVRYTMVKVNVEDLPRSLSFYEKVIGLKESHRFGGTAPNFPLEVMLSEGGDNFEAQIVLVDDKTKPPLQLGTGLRNLVFVVPDVREVVRRVTVAGLPVTVQPTDNKMAEIGFAAGLTVAFVKDPDGYPIELVQWNR